MWRCPLGTLPKQQEALTKMATKKVKTTKKVRDYIAFCEYVISHSDRERPAYIIDKREDMEDYIAKIRREFEAVTKLAQLIDEINGMPEPQTTNTPNVVIIPPTRMRRR